MSIAFIVQILFDYDRPNLILKKQWIKDRFEFFNRFTLPSLLNQSFQDFRIFVLCGLRNKDLTTQFPWHSKLTVCYDLGKKKYEKVNTDYIAILRLESDDMLHANGMAEIRDNLILSGKRECLIFRRNIKWNFRWQFIMPFYQKASPFFTHIFPRRIYKDWKAFSRLHFMQHGRAGGRLQSTKELSGHKICVIKHDNNISRIRQGLKLTVFDEEKRQLLAIKDKNIILDRGKIKDILKDFSVDEKWIK